MSYYVYVNKPTSKARIHKGLCSWCNNGKGCHSANRRTENGEWHIFKTIKEAENFARKSDKRVSKCQHCLKHEN